MAELETSEPTITIAGKAAAQAKAEAIKLKRELPKKPGNKVTFEELLAWLRLLEEDEQRERVMIYLYRVTPKINRQFADPTAYNNIDVFSGDFTKFDEQYFIDVHGGGKYKLVIKDTDDVKNRDGYFTCLHEVNMLQYPPKVSLEEVVWNDASPDMKRYRAWAIAHKIIDESNMPIIEKKETLTPVVADNTVPLMKMFMEWTSKMNNEQQEKVKAALGGNDSIGKGVSDILLEKMKQDDPTKIVTIVTALMTAMKGAEPKPLPQTDLLASILPFMKMMQDSADRNTQLMITMMDKMSSKGGEEKDEFDKMEKMLSIARQIKGGGMGESHEKSMTETILELGSAILPPALNIVSNIVAMNAAAKGVGNVTPVKNVSAMENVVSRAKEASQEQTNGLPSPQASPQMGGSVTQDQARMALAQFGPLINTALEDGKEGWEFAEDIERLFKAPAVNVMIKDGATPLVNAAKSIPEFWNPLVGTYGEPHLVKWITDFCNYKSIINGMEEEQDKEEKK